VFSIGSADVTVNDVSPEIVVKAPTGGSTGGGSSRSVGGSAESSSFEKHIEVVRGGDSLSFEISVTPSYANTSLQDLTLTLDGFLEQYMVISPDVISILNYGEAQNFTVVIDAPSYKGYEEHNLTATIRGYLVRGDSVSDYVETHSIRLIIQEVSSEETLEIIELAEEYLREMTENGFNVDDVLSWLAEAKVKISEGINNEAYYLAAKVIETKEKAFSVNDLIRGLIEISGNPRKNHFLTGNVVDSLSGGEWSFWNLFRLTSVTGNVVAAADYSEPLRDLRVKESAFSSDEVREILELAVVAFDRGDYELAEERANDARSLMLLERKGNVGLFFYVYWQTILVFLVLFLLIGIFVYRKYQKVSVAKKVLDSNREEKNVRDLMVSAQKDYFGKKMGPDEYKGAMKGYKKKVVSLKADRRKLRKKARVMLGAEQLLKDLASEEKGIEDEMKKIQTAYYKDKRIPEEEYKLEFEALTERLSEVEEEKIFLGVEGKKGAKIKKSWSNVKGKLKGGDSK
jgi:hypothetical protein